MIIVVVRDKNRSEAESSNLFAIKSHRRESVAVSAKGIFKDRIKNDFSFAVLKNIASVKDPRDF